MFLPLYLDWDRGEQVVWNCYPNSFTSIWLPSAMSAVMVALQQKRIGCCFCHQFILREVGSLALASSACDSWSRLSSKMDENDYFIAVVINAYLTVTLHAFQRIEKKYQGLKDRYHKQNRNGMVTWWTLLRLVAFLLWIT
jgi:hypothetical protein